MASIFGRNRYNTAIIAVSILSLLAGCSDDTVSPAKIIGRKDFYISTKSTHYNQGDTIRITAKWSGEIGGKGIIGLIAHFSTITDTLIVLSSPKDTLVFFTTEDPIANENISQIDFTEGEMEYNWDVYVPPGMTSPVRFEAGIVYDSVIVDGQLYSLDDPKVAEIYPYPYGAQSSYFSYNEIVLHPR